MVAWLIPGVFAYLYAVFGGIEFALPVLRLVTVNERDQAVINRWFSPVWEVTNVFLVMAITGFAAVFPLVLPILTPALRWLLLLVGLGLGLRALIVLIVFYGQAKNQLTNWLLAAISLILPAMLAQVVLDLISPNPAPVQQVCTALIAIFISLALGSGFLLMVRPAAPYRRVTILSLLLAAVAAYPLGHIASLTPIAAMIMGAATLAASLTIVFRSRWMPLVASWLALTLVFVRILQRQWPYVLYPNVTYAQVAAAPAIHQAIVWGMVVGVILSLPGLAWLVVVLAKNFGQAV